MGGPVRTPVQRTADGVWLKRDDLYEFGGAWGGKVRTCVALATEGLARPQGATALVTAGGRYSPQVQIVARVAKALGLDARCHVPAGEPGPTLQDAVAQGATLVAHKPGRNSVLVARARQDAEDDTGAVLVPFGMECAQAVYQTAGQVGNLPRHLSGRVVVPVGSGMSLAGVLAGRALYGMEWPVLGVWVGADPTARLDRWAPFWRMDAMLVQAPDGYAQPLRDVQVDGLGLDPYYEAKAAQYVRPGDLLWVVGVRTT